MPDIVEIAAQVDVDDACLVLNDRSRHTVHRFMGCPLWTVSKRSSERSVFRGRLRVGSWAHSDPDLQGRRSEQTPLRYQTPEYLALEVACGTRGQSCTAYPGGRRWRTSVRNVRRSDAGRADRRRTLRKMPLKTHSLYSYLSKGRGTASFKRCRSQADRAKTRREFPYDRAKGRFSRFFALCAAGVRIPTEPATYSDSNPATLIDAAPVGLWQGDHRQ